jgi:hypothetical protein
MVRDAKISVVYFGNYSRFFALDGDMNGAISCESNHLV